MGRRSTPEQLPDADGEEVEDDERDGEREHGEGVRARGEDGGDHHDDDDRPAPGAEQAGRCHDARQLERDEDDGELEGQAEDRHHQEDQAQIRDRVVDRLQVRATDGLQPSQRVRERDVRRRRPEEEEHEGAHHEGDGVPPFARLEAGGHEAPDLEQDHRRREDETTEEGDLHAERQAVERRRHEQVAAAVRRDQERRAPLAVWCRVDASTLHSGCSRKLQYRLVGERRRWWPRSRRRWRR